MQFWRAIFLVGATLLACVHTSPAINTAARAHKAHTQENSFGGNPFSSPGYVAWGCNSLNRGVALTFDDGPWEYTSALLDHLKDLGVKATFFVVGVYLEKYSAVVQRAAAEGHEIGSHTWNHANLSELQMPELQWQVEHTERAIEELIGRRPYLLRPPYGAVNHAARQYLASRNYTIVMWSGGCIDWFYQDFAAELPVYVNGLADAGGLLCFHDPTYSTVEGIERLVRVFRATVPQTTANPQGRNIIAMTECLSKDNE